MAVLLCDRLLRPQGVAGLLIVFLVVSLGCQGGPLIRGQSPEATPPRLLAIPELEVTDKADKTDDSTTGPPITGVQVEGNDAISERDIRHLLRVHLEALGDQLLDVPGAHLVPG